MFSLRSGGERGRTVLDWLDSYHTFSFGDYHDPAHMGFRVLRVINEDLVAPGKGFGTHGHRDMEIVTYLLEGALEHKDSLGHGSVIRPGDVQRMTAGTGVLHSEFNPSAAEPAHLLQIWILPRSRGLAPEYEQRSFPAPERQGRLRLVASGSGREGSVTMHQDADLYASLLPPGVEVAHPLAPGRHSWLQVARGAVTVEGRALEAGDGAAISELQAVPIRAEAPSEILLFDLP